MSRLLPRIRLRTRQAPSLLGQKILVTIDRWEVTSRLVVFPLHGNRLNFVIDTQKVISSEPLERQKAKKLSRKVYYSNLKFRIGPLGALYWIVCLKKETRGLFHLKPLNRTNGKGERILETLSFAA